MKYWQYTVVFQEMPHDIALAFELTNCPLSCFNCHSPHLQQDVGHDLTLSIFSQIVDKYLGFVSAVMFLGSAYNQDDNKLLIDMLEFCKNRGLKTCVWTGQDDVCPDIKSRLDFLKTGQYIEKLGGLDSETTNQRYIDLRTNTEVTRSRVNA